MKQEKNCETCGKLFCKKQSSSQKDWENVVKFCSRSCVNKGRRSPFKGKARWSEKYKTNLSQKMIGIRYNTGRTHIKKGQHLSPATEFGKVPPWNKGKENPHFKGEKNPKWKGGITPENKKIRFSREYHEIRMKCFERDDYTCQNCKECRTPGNRIILNAHHIKPFSIHPELRFELSNLITLCEKCHRKTDSYGVNL